MHSLFQRTSLGALTNSKLSLVSSSARNNAMTFDTRVYFSARLTGCQLAAGTGDSPATVDVVYKRGDAVWYRQRDGTEVPAKVRKGTMHQHWPHTAHM